MAVQFCDDFHGYGTDASLMLNGLYAEMASGTLQEDPDPNITGTVWAYGVNPLNGTKMRRVLPRTVTTGGFAFRLWLSALPSNDSSSLVFGFSNAGNTYQVYFRVSANGRILVSTGGGSDISASANPVLTANSWNHIEVKFVASATVGTLEFRINGVPITMSASTGLNTGTSYAQFRIDNPNSTSGPTFYVKDLITWDTSGTNNNDFFGTVLVLSRTTNSDITLGGWTTSTGVTGWNLLDNSPPLDNTEYIAADATPPAASKFGLTSLPVDITSVRAMVIQNRARKVDGGDGTLQAALISGATTGTGVDRPVTTAFTYYEDVYDHDPNGGGNWTPSSANAATLQINRTT